MGNALIYTVTETTLTTGKYTSCTVSNNTSYSYFVLGLSNTDTTATIYKSIDGITFETDDLSTITTTKTNYTGQIITNSDGTYVFAVFSNYIFISQDGGSTYAILPQNNNPDIIGCAIGYGGADGAIPYLYYIAKFSDSYK